jgi:hypothetical protein
LSLKTVDDMVGRIFATLEEQEIADNTYVMLTSDNGWLEGHHRMLGKSVPYDRGTKVPLLVMGPGVPTATVNHLIAHIDIGPTIVELASGITPAWVDGKSFRDVLFNPDIDARTWREPILIETWSTLNMMGLADPIEFVSSALRYYDESYIEWFNGDAEYYHLPDDPHQVRNRFDQLSSQQQLRMAADIRAIKTPMDPEVGIITPFGVDGIVGRQFNLQGFAEDDEGIWGVKVALVDQTTHRYWNGNAWQTDFAQLTTELTNPGGQLTKWRIPIDIPREVATENTIKLRVWPIDVAGNYRRDIESYFRLDLTSPVCEIEQPTRHQRVPPQLTISGTAVDDSEVGQVRLVIKNRDTGDYWNGSVMVDDWNYHTAMILDNSQWKFDAELPAGRYLVSVRGIDEHGNFATEVVTQVFVVQ